MLAQGKKANSALHVTFLLLPSETEIHMFCRLLPNKHIYISTPTHINEGYDNSVFRVVLQVPDTVEWLMLSVTEQLRGRQLITDLENKVSRLHFHVL